MEYRQLGGSGLYVPALCLGTATFGGTNGFEGWGHTEVEEATRMVNLCLDAGVNLFDTADVYSNGLSEEILGNPRIEESPLDLHEGDFQPKPGEP